MNGTSKWKTKLRKQRVIKLRVHKLVLRSVCHWSCFTTAATDSLQAG